MPNTTPAVDQSMDQTKTLTQPSKPIQLYDSNPAGLGFVLRPVKPIKIPVINGGNALDTTTFTTEPTDSTPAASATTVNTDSVTVAIAAQGIVEMGELLRARLLESSAVVNPTYTDSGPLIRLPLPEKIKDSLKLSYSTADMGLVAAGVLFGQDVAEGFKTGPGLASSLAGNASYLIRTLLNGLGTAVGGASQKFAGNIPNPFSSAIFEKVTPRSFNFSWTIQPQDAKESENLKEVINVLRYWSLPNPSFDRLILDVPFEWELAFVGTQFLYAFSRCVMTDLDIDYSASGMNVFMVGGAPQAVTITIGFQEIYPLDKSVIAEGPSSMLPTSGLADPPPNTAEDVATENAAIDLAKSLEAINNEVVRLNNAVVAIEKAIKINECNPAPDSVECRGAPKSEGGFAIWNAKGLSLANSLTTARVDLVTAKATKTDLQAQKTALEGGP